MPRQPASVPKGTDVVTLGLRLAHLIRQEFGARMAHEQWAIDANLRRGCFGVLRAVVAADEPMSQRDVAERTGIDASDVVDLVDRLERAGYLRRERDEQDRRRNALAVTPAGHRAIARLSIVSHAVDEAVLDVLAPGERDELRRLLGRVVDAHDRPAVAARAIGA